MIYDEKRVKLMFGVFHHWVSCCFDNFEGPLGLLSIYEQIFSQGSHELAFGSFVSTMA